MNMKTKICGKITPMGLYECKFKKGHKGNHSWDRQTDKTTAIDEHGLYDDLRLCGYTEEARRTICRAVNSYDALKAVAESAKELSKAYAISNGSQSAIRYVRAKREVLDCELANLAKVQGES